MIELIRPFEDYLKTQTGITTIIEPVVPAPNKPHIKIIPKSLNVGIKESHQDKSKIKYQTEIGFYLELNVQGNGGNSVFLKQIFEHSFQLNKLLMNRGSFDESQKSIKIMIDESNYLKVQLNKLDESKIEVDEKKEAFLFIEQWEGILYCSDLSGIYGESYEFETIPTLEQINLTSISLD